MSMPVNVVHSVSLRYIAYLNHKLFIQLPVNGHLAFFFFFAIINNDAINILCIHSTWHSYASCIFLKVDNLGVRKCQCRRFKRCWLHPWVQTIPWNRKWQPTPLFWPGKLHGQKPDEIQSMGSRRVENDLQCFLQ